MEIVKKMLTKLSSRKFLIAVGGVASGLLLILNGSQQEGLIAICTSIVTYLAAEGYIDAKAVKTTEDKRNECERETGAAN